MKQLKKGDTIGIFSPSSPATVFAPKRYQRAKEYIEHQGFKIKEGRLTGQSDQYRSGSIEARARELNDLIHDPDVDCIMSTIGGMNSNSILPYIDYDYLQHHPKIVIGYSDVTAILLAIYEKTGLTTFYGPAMVASFGEFPHFVDKTFEYFGDILVRPMNLPLELKTPSEWTDEFIHWEEQTGAKKGKPNKLITVNPGVSKGRLIGGNLNTMQGIWGTEYMPEIKTGDILLIEDSLKDIATIERSFSLLKLSGVFKKIGGLILGKHEIFDDRGTGRKPYEVLKEVMGPLDFPVLAEFDCCHTHPMLTVPIGATVELDADRQTLTILDLPAAP